MGKSTGTGGGGGGGKNKSKGGGVNPRDTLTDAQKPFFDNVAKTLSTKTTTERQEIYRVTRTDLEKRLNAEKEQLGSARQASVNTREIRDILKKNPEKIKDLESRLQVLTAVEKTLG